MISSPSSLCFSSFYSVFAQIDKNPSNGCTEGRSPSHTRHSEQMQTGEHFWGRPKGQLLLTPQLPRAQSGVSHFFPLNCVLPFGKGGHDKAFEKILLRFGWKSQTLYRNDPLSCPASCTGAGMVQKGSMRCLARTRIVPSSSEDVGVSEISISNTIPCCLCSPRAGSGCRGNSATLQAPEPAEGREQGGLGGCFSARPPLEVKPAVIRIALAGRKISFHCW